MSVSANMSAHRLGSPFLGRVFNGATMGVRFIVYSAALVTIDDRWAISLVVGHSCFVRAVDGDLIEVRSKSVSVSVRVGEQSSLKHFVV